MCVNSFEKFDKMKLPGKKTTSTTHEQMSILVMKIMSMLCKFGMNLE